MSSFDFIVIGSGISGMSFAHHMTAKGHKVLIMEKKEYAGGCVRSLIYDDFWLELGGHTIYNSYRTFIQTLRELGAESSFIERSKASFKIYRDGHTAPLMSALSKFELMLNGPKIFFTKKQGKTVREYYSSVLGRKNYENMFSAMLQAVISQDASDFPADSLLKKRERDNTAPRNFTLQGGMSSFINKVSQKSGITVKTDCEAVDITHADGIYTVETKTGEKFTAKSVTLACPPPAAGRLLAKVQPEISALLSEVKGVKVETLGVIVKKEDISIDPFSFIIAKDDDFTSVVSRDILPHDKYRGFAFHFRADRLDMEGKTARVEDVLGIDRGSIMAKAYTVHFSPTFGIDHSKRIEKLDRLLAETSGLHIVGNYFGGIAIEDCALRAAKSAGDAG
jgi:protoporphyrinogen oxidase